MAIKRDITKPAFDEVELKVIEGIEYALDRMHPEPKELWNYRFYYWRNVGFEYCKFSLHTTLRPLRVFTIDGDTFEETVGKMYKVIAQLP